MANLRTHAWALYDFANHIWVLNMFSLYFALWVTKDMGAPDLAYSSALSLSLLATAIAAPALGSISDRVGKRTPFVIAFALTCCLCTALLPVVIKLFGGGTASLVAGLALFAVASFGYGIAQVFYNAQLPTLVPPEKIGGLSGYGVALGYFGSFAGILLVTPFVTGKLLKWSVPLAAGGNVAAFLPTACFFLLFALPHFLIVKDPEGPVAERAGKSWAQIVETFKAARAVPGMIRYLFANLLFFDALNTVVGFMAVYAVKVVGFDEKKQEVQLVLLLATTCAALGGFVWGKVVDRIGPKRALQLDLMLWLVVLVGIIGIHQKPLFTFVLAPLVGVAMGGTWTASRTLLSRLSPPGRQAEFFGLYTLAGKCAAVIGPMTWGLVTFALASMPVARYQVAIACQLVFVLAGFLLLARVPADRPALSLAEA